MKKDYNPGHKITVTSIPETINNVALIGKTGIVTGNDGEGCFVTIEGNDWYFPYENIELSN